MSTGSEQDNFTIEEIIDEPATEEETFYADMGNAMVRDALPFMNQVLRQLVTLCTALLGGTLVFFKEDLVRPGVKVAAAFIFLAGLSFAFLGMLPIRERIHRGFPQQVQETVEKAIAAKSWKLRVSAVAVFVGLAVLLLGIVIRNQ